MPQFVARAIALIVLLISIEPAAAQEAYFFEYGKTFYGGFSLGVNFSQVEGDYIKGFNKVGLNLGPVVYARLGGEFGGSLELNYNQKGSKVRRPTTSAASGAYIERYDIKLNYVEMPLLLHLFRPEIS